MSSLDGVSSAQKNQRLGSFDQTAPIAPSDLSLLSSIALDHLEKNNLKNEIASLKTHRNSIKNVILAKKQEILNLISPKVD